ncbi:tetratricopeptide repeat protein, partial [Parapedobacter sp. GCM10030251]|uniref:tetratricopeptide repeat protein n=1 Tax=Parapedobacter sp. GCM10030251 TaxID=3273419 RepID=UPI00361E351E
MKNKLLGTGILFFRVIFPMVILLLAFSATYCQEQLGLRDRAEQAFLRYEYANAAALYVKLADSRKPRLADLERLAYCYMQMKDYESAENWYSRVAAMDGSSPENLLRYGEVLKMNGKYAGAKEQLEAYAEKTGDRGRVSVQ